MQRARGGTSSLKHPRPPSARHRRFYLPVIFFIQVVPLCGVLWALGAAVFFGQYPTALDLALCATFFALTMVGLEVGYHRYFSHQAFKTSTFFARCLAVLGSMGFQGGVIWWAATHKRHHAFSDVDGDPTSPHLPPHNGSFAGFMYAHFGWMLDPASQNPGRWAQQVAPLYQDSFLFFLNQRYFQISLIGLLIPAALGALIGGSAQAAFGGFLWGGLIRAFLVSHSIYSLNSFCHMMGAVDFPGTRDQSRNNAWLFLPTFGGSWHNNHHAFPRTATNQFRWWQIDISGSLIGLLERFGVVWDVYRPSREAIEARRSKKSTA